MLSQDVKKKQRLDFCTKYIPVLEMIEADSDLKEACADHSIYKNDDKHGSLIHFLYRYFMEDAYQNDIVVHNYGDMVVTVRMKDKVAAPA